MITRGLCSHNARFFNDDVTAIGVSYTLRRFCLEIGSPIGAEGNSQTTRGSIVVELRIYASLGLNELRSLTHWGRVTHICVGNLTTTGSENGLSPGRCQAIIWTNAGILLFGPLGTNFSEIWIEFHTFSFTKMHLKMSSGKWRPFCLGLNVLTVDLMRCSRHL